jgi:hypothetical protein
MSDTVITAKEAYLQAHKNISRVIDMLNRTIHEAMEKGEFTCNVFLTDAEYHIALPHIADYRVQKLERSGSRSFKYLLDFSQEPISA